MSKFKDVLLGFDPGRQPPSVTQQQMYAAMSKLQRDQLQAMQNMAPKPASYNPYPTPIKENEYSLPYRETDKLFTCWRWWRCVMKDGEPYLQSTYKDTVWNGPVMRTDKPAPGDQLGFHGYFVFNAPVVGIDYRPTVPRDIYYPDVESIIYPIGGEIELFGLCIVHDLGVRGERARIKRLQVYPRHMPFCRPETIKQLADRYDCPVEPAEWFDPADLLPEDDPR